MKHGAQAKGYDSQKKRFFCLSSTILVIAEARRKEKSGKQLERRLQSRQMFLGITLCD